MNTAALAKIKMMKASLRCFVLGLFSLFPIFGLPFALGALWVSGKARAQEKHFWNPARPYRIWGVVCAAVGAVVWSVVDTFIIYHLFDVYSSS